MENNYQLISLKANFDERKEGGDTKDWEEDHESSWYLNHTSTPNSS